MANATGEVQTYGALSFEGAFSVLLGVSGTMDVANLADGAGETNEVDATGVALGDIVLGVSCSVSVAGITVTAFVSAANVVSVRFQNESGGALDLASCTVKVLVGRPRF